MKRGAKSNDGRHEPSLSAHCRSTRVGRSLLVRQINAGRYAKFIILHQTLFVARR